MTEYQPTPQTPEQVDQGLRDAFRQAMKDGVMDATPYLKQMTYKSDIEKTEAEIKVLQKKLELLKEIEKHRSPAEEAFKEVYGYYPEVCERSVWVAFQKGYEEAQKDYKVGEYQPTPQTPEQVEQGLRDAMKQAKKDGVFDEPSKPMDDAINRLIEKYKSQKLWNMMRNELGYSIDCCDEIVDAVEEWLPKEQSAAGSQNTFVECNVEGYNDCLREMKEMLR
jgi:hypothetical protein